MIRTLLIAVALLCGLVTPAAAATIFWDGNGGSPPNGTFSTSANWNPDTVPDIGDTANFNIADTYTATLVQFADSDALTVSAGDVTLESNGFHQFYDIITGAADLTVRGGTLRVGSTGNTIDIDVGDQLDIGDATANGFVIISGSGTRLDATGTNAQSLGLSGFQGHLTYQDGAKGTIGGTFSLGDSGGVSSWGGLFVKSDADVTTANLRLAHQNSLGGIGDVEVDGVGSTVTQSGASTLVIGGTGTAITRGTVEVKNGGTFTSGTGTTTVNESGRIDIGVTGDGFFNANGDVTVDGGTITRGNLPSAFNLASGLTLTATNGAQINFTGNYDIDLGTTFDIQSGADFSTTDFLDIGDSGGDGTLLVDGVGSGVTTTSFSFWGDAGNTADVTFRNGATGNLGNIRLARSSTGGTTGIFNVESGATVTTGRLDVATAGGATTSGTITVDGGGPL